MTRRKRSKYKKTGATQRRGKAFYPDVPVVWIDEAPPAQVLDQLMQRWQPNPQPKK